MVQVKTDLDSNRKKGAISLLLGCPTIDDQAIRRFMMSLLRETRESLRSSPFFALFVVISLAYVGLIGLMVALMAFRLNTLLPGPFAQMTHFTEPHHRVHDLTFGFLFAPAVVGILAQLRRPAQNVAGMTMALIPWVALLLAAVLSDAFIAVVLSNPSRLAIVVTLFTALLHPSGRTFFSSVRLPRINWNLLGLVAVAAVPLLAFAATNIQLQATVLDEHAGMGHYGFMAAFAFTVVGIGLLASLRPEGWRLAAWIAGVLPALLGLTSIVYPNVASSLDLIWAVAAIAWGAAFIVATEVSKNKERSVVGVRGAVPAAEGAQEIEIGR